MADRKVNPNDASYISCVDFSVILDWKSEISEESHRESPGFLRCIPLCGIEGDRLLALAGYCLADHVPALDALVVTHFDDLDPLLTFGRESPADLCRGFVGVC